ncbi:MAG: hypothetical protein JXD23_16560 [Spirochaetales bacterium]|nr:hypothetical protein [Spirochaetales bacterium]
MPQKILQRVNRTLILAAVDTLILSACTAIGAFVVPALAGPGLSPRAAAFVVLGCFIGGLALCLAVNRRFMRKEKE